MKIRTYRVKAPRVVSPRIVHQDGWRQLLWWALGLLLLIGVGWQAWELGKRQGGHDSRRSLAEKVALARQLDEQARSLAELRSEAARYRREAEIEKLAARELQKELIALQDERSRLKSEMEMLRGLISNNSGSLYIRQFELQTLEQPRQFRYAFTLVQVMEKVKKTRGKLLMKISGRLKGKKKQLDRAAFSPDGEKTLKLEFQHYADIQGEIELPEGFVPSKIQVEFLPRNKELKKLHTVFPWPEEEMLKSE